jgi:hypothetical protein
MFKLLTEDGVWQTLLKRKYVGSKKWLESTSQWRREQSDIPVDNNKKIWKMKIPLKTKFFG